MREFDASCLTSVEPLSAKEILAIRRRAGVSQGVFAHYLNVRPKLVSEWERGEKKPSGPSLKLLSIVKNKDWGGTPKGSRPGRRLCCPGPYPPSLRPPTSWIFPTNPRAATPPPPCVGST